MIHQILKAQNENSISWKSEAATIYFQLFYYSSKGVLLRKSCECKTVQVKSEIDLVNSRFFVTPKKLDFNVTQWIKW